MYYPDEIIEEVREKNNIVDVVGERVRIQKKGSSYFGLCPFHNEKSPSFSVNEPRQIFHCFGCGASGNVFTFLMKYENMTFQEAVQALAERAGVKLPEQEQSPQAKQASNRRAQLLEICKEAAKYFYVSLREERGAQGMEYFRKRQLTDETMQRFGLGYSHKTSSDLCKYLKSKGYDDKLIIEAGLGTFDERYGMHDKFWNRVMFPIQDQNHRVIGFGGRVMGDGEPKYLNSPETPIFDKSRNLYGLNYARSSRAGNIILCEGYMDVIAMHQAGFTQAVASLGTAFTEGQANILRRYAQNILLAYDSDGPGVKAALRAIGILRECGLSGKIIHMEPYKDPDEFIKNLGKDAFQERIDKAENSFFFEIRIMGREYHMDDPDEKTRYYHAIAKKLITTFPEEVERENYLQAVAAEFTIGTDQLRKLVLQEASAGITVPQRPRSGIQKKDTDTSAVKAEKMLLSWFTDVPGLYKKVRKYLTPDDFPDPVFHKVAEKLFEQLEQDQVNPASIISTFEAEEDQRKAGSVFNAQVGDLKTQQDKEKAFQDLLCTVKKNSYEQLSASLAGDVNALGKLIEGKKMLEELNRIHISMDDLL
ncbi:MAG: DNA primase [Lachnospiraceae bacterium]|nr:DNA primase [Lachnospiraceae bacterium]